MVASKKYLFIAGGIGITPMLPMINAAIASGADWKLVYCGRSINSMAFVDQLNTLGTNQVKIHESDSNGILDLAKLLNSADVNAAVYCCGPESMLQAVDDATQAWKEGRLHVERFSAASHSPVEDNKTFEVEFARSGIIAIVPCNRTILEVAEEHGVDIDSSCQDGVCGSCETNVISGMPDHRDSILSAKQRALGKTMMVCVSRSCSARLVLDA